MDRFLKHKGINYEVYVVEQTDNDKKFNRGWLINVGYILSNSTCDYLVQHDVDMLPMDVSLYENSSSLKFFDFLQDKLPYEYPTISPGQKITLKQCRTETVNNCGIPTSMFNGNHPVKWYNSAQFIGAVLLMTHAQFKASVSLLAHFIHAACLMSTRTPPVYATQGGFSTHFWGWGGESPLVC